MLVSSALAITEDRTEPIKNDAIVIAINIISYYVKPKGSEMIRQNKKSKQKRIVTLQRPIYYPCIPSTRFLRIEVTRR